MFCKKFDLFFKILVLLIFEMYFKFFDSFRDLIFKFIFCCFLFHFILSNEVLSLLGYCLFILLLLYTLFLWYTLFKFIYCINNVLIQMSSNTALKGFNRTTPLLTPTLLLFNLCQFRVQFGYTWTLAVHLYIILT